MSTAPRVSVVMPTYNRRDTILRAVESVRAQSFGDFELVVVDDGSTDGTHELFEGGAGIARIDPRVRLIRQANQGVGGARNTAMTAARGELIAFLDSDDAWPAHHLALATAFFDAHPGEDAFTSEFWEDFGGHGYVKHYRVETGDWYPRTAKRIGSHAFDQPPPHGDPYLWLYETREPLGTWARPALERSPFLDHAYHYRGDVFRAWRWGWMMAMQPTVITRRALEAVGLNDTSYAIACDFGWLAELCRKFPMNFLSVPGGIKHEYAEGKKPVSEGHLVTGRSAIRFHQDVLRFHEELFWKANPTDPELTALRGLRQSLVAQAALAKGERDLARGYLEQAVKSYPGADTTALLWLAKAAPRDEVASLVYRNSMRGVWFADRVRRSLHGLVSR
jgi:glycosyltransferase involved in cell wall biosynthesis